MSLPGRSVLLLNRKNVSFHLFRFRVYIVSQIRNSLFTSFIVIIQEIIFHVIFVVSDNRS